MHKVLANGFLAIGIPKHDVGVEAHADRPLLRVHPVHLRVVGRGQRDEFVGRDAAFGNALTPEDLQTRLHARNAIRHPAKRGARLRILLAVRALVIERAMIGRESREYALLDSFPDGSPAGVVARRR